MIVGGILLLYIYDHSTQRSTNDEIQTVTTVMNSFIATTDEQCVLRQLLTFHTFRTITFIPYQTNESNQSCYHCCKQSVVNNEAKELAFICFISNNISTLLPYSSKYTIYEIQELIENKNDDVLVCGFF